MLGKSVYLVFLAVMCAEDIRSKTVSLPVIAGFSAAGILIYMVVRPFTPGELLAGAGIGAVLFLLSLIKEEIGRGDAYIFITGGIYLGFWENLSVLITSFVFAAVFSVFLLIIKRCGAKQEIIFAPFIMGAYIAVLI